MATEEVDQPSAWTDNDEKQSNCNIFVDEFSHIPSEEESNVSETDEASEFICIDGIVKDDFTNEINEVNRIDEFDDNHTNENNEITHTDIVQNDTNVIDKDNQTEERQNSRMSFSSDDEEECVQGRGGDIIRAKRKNFRCGKCGRDFVTRSNFKRHLATHDVDQPKCNVCGKLFSRRSHLNDHMTVHTKIKEFKCDLCGKGYSRRSTLKVHMAVHTGERPHKCHLCDKRFSQKNVLKTHMTVHSGEKLYVCHMCGKRFSQRAGLADHVASHSINSPLKCTICGKSHAFKSYLMRHMKTHHQKRQFVLKESGGFTLSHNESQSDSLTIDSSKIARISTLLTIAANEEKKKSEDGSKPFKCSVCGRGYSRNFTLTMHMRVHTGVKEFKCDLCGKNFARKSVLKNHMIVHSGERRFKCNFCEKEFSQQAGLTEHLVKHNTESTFKCIICGKKSAFKSSYIKHMRSHQREIKESDLEFKIKLDSLNLSEINAADILQSSIANDLEPSSSSTESFSVVKEEEHPTEVSDHTMSDSENKTDIEEEKDLESSLTESRRMFKLEKNNHEPPDHLVYIKEELDSDCEKDSDI